jgi:hypothetical protein
MVSDHAACGGWPLSNVHEIRETIRGPVDQLLAEVLCSGGFEIRLQIQKDPKFLKNNFTTDIIDIILLKL